MSEKIHNLHTLVDDRMAYPVQNSIIEICMWNDISFFDLCHDRPKRFSSIQECVFEKLRLYMPGGDVYAGRKKKLCD